MSQRASRIVVHALAWLGCLALLAGCAGEPDTLDAVRQRGALYIGLDPSYPPFAALAPDGGLYGLDVDLGRELAGRLGVEAHFVLLGYDGLYHALEIREVDALLSALVIDPRQMADVQYSHGYLEAGLVLVVPAEKSYVLSAMRDLTGQTVAVEYASDGDVEARRWARRRGDLTILARTTADEALAAVLAGQAEVALVDAVSARLFLHGHPSLTLAPKPVVSDPLALAVRREDRSLLRAINQALEAMAADGALETLLARWL